VVVSIDGLPKGAAADVARELVGLPAVITARPANGTGAFELQIAADGAIGDRIAADVLAPLNAKLGEKCFALGATAGDRVSVAFDARCTQPDVLSRLETNPPAALYGAPASRAKAVVKNPETLRKLSV
jgi:hypothetical protein